MFFVMLFRFFVNLFSKKKPAFVERVEQAQEEAKQVFRHPEPVAHNNRKNTRGRFTQYINQKDGTTKAIFHDAGGASKPK